MTFDGASIAGFDSKILALQGQAESTKSEAFADDVTGKVALLKGNINLAFSHFAKAMDSRSAVDALQSEISAASADKASAEREVQVSAEKSNNKKPEIAKDPQEKQDSSKSGLKYLNPAD